MSFAFTRGRGPAQVDIHSPPLLRPFNPTLNVTRNANGRITILEWVQSGTTVRRTITRDGDDNISVIGPWVEV